jgi:phage shock protein A
MTILKRITATFKANLEQVVDQIENQDAVVEAAIREIRQATAKTKVNLQRVRRDRAELERKIADLKTMEQQWQTRALECAADDEHTALICLERRNLCRTKREAMRDALARQIEAETQLEAGLAHSEERVESLTRQRHILRSRESAALAAKSCQPWGDQPIDVDSVFDRWEGRILENEMSSVQVDIDFDPLEQRFSQQEKHKGLKNELEALIQAQENNDE